VGGQNGGQTNDLKILSLRGSAIVDARTNTLIVRETAKRLEEAKKLIRKLDVPVRQVMIESRIVIASNNFAKELGVRFGVAKQVSFNGNNFAVGGKGTRGNGDTLPTQSGDIGTLTDQLVELGTANNPYGALGMTLARGADYVLNLELSALQEQGRGEVLSNPRVMTSDRCQATIKQGEQIPYQTVSQNGTQTQFKDAVLQLDVLPQITPSGSIMMNLKISKDARGDKTPDGQLPINTREVETNVHVMDGETIVLGGVFEGTQANTTGSVPFFSDIPGIGFLFKRTNNTDNKTELLFFVTPKIVKDNAASN
jgi:type IV pilus assembly protein PilQ